MRNFLKGFLFLNILFFLLVLVNLIPRDLIYNNLYESIKYYREIGVTTNSGMATSNDINSDSNELNVIYCVDSNRPVYSALVSPFYRIDSTQDFLSIAENLIINKLVSNYNYNRYWHGYQILWRPLLILFDYSEIMIISLIIYSCLLVYLLYKLLKNNYKDLALGLGLMHIFYIIPFLFNTVQNIPVFFIMLLSCIFVVSDKLDAHLIFIFNGVCTAFFDFWTAETIALTVPLLVYTYLNKNNLKYKIHIKLGLSWLFSYCFTFIYKWLISSIIYNENYFKIAIDKFKTHTSQFDRLTSIKFNINVLFNSITSFNNTFNIFILSLSIFILIVYFLRKQGCEKYIIFILLICVIPYLRYFVLYEHSWGFAAFTYRAQLVLIPSLVLIFRELDFSLLWRRS